jgi:hypothetical protein
VASRRIRLSLSTVKRAPPHVTTHHRRGLGRRAAGPGAGAAGGSTGTAEALTANVCVITAPEDTTISKDSKDRHRRGGTIIARDALLVAGTRVGGRAGRHPVHVAGGASRERARFMTS